MSLPETVPWYELDGDDDIGGYTLGVHFAGHIDPDEAVALAWVFMDEYGVPGTIRRGGPRHTWLRKVPMRGGSRYLRCGPGPGATPVTYVEWSYSWDSKVCDMRPACFEQAVAGVPRQQVIDPPGDDEQYVYLCREHHRVFEEALRAARFAAVAAQ